MPRRSPVASSDTVANPSVLSARTTASCNAGGAAGHDDGSSMIRHHVSCHHRPRCTTSASVRRGWACDRTQVRPVPKGDQASRTHGRVEAPRTSRARAWSAHPRLAAADPQVRSPLPSSTSPPDRGRSESLRPRWRPPKLAQRGRWWPPIRRSSLGRSPHLRQARKLFAVVHDDKIPTLAVARRWRPSCQVRAPVRVFPSANGRSLKSRTCRLDKIVFTSLHDACRLWLSGVIRQRVCPHSSREVLHNPVGSSA